MFVREKHPVSKRSAVIESNDICAWFYLSAPDSDAIEKDVWLYNLILAPKRDEIKKFRGEPPAAPLNVIYFPGTLGPLTDKNIKFRWSKDGEAVAAWFFGELHAYILPESKLGYSRLHKEDSPWGHPINFNEYDKYDKYDKYFES